MMKTRNVAVIVIATLLLALLAACGGQGEPGSSTVKVSLPANNGSTGYTWSYTMDKEGILTEQSSDYIVPADAAPGTPGQQEYVFAAGADGQVVISFSYAQPWQPDAIDSTSVRTYQVNGGKVTEVSVVDNINDNLIN